MDYPRRIGYEGFFTLEIITTPDGPREVLRTTDSVAVLLYDRSNRRIVLVRQPRVAMATDENPHGYLTELVAGRLDAPIDVKALIVKEAREEAGIRLTEDRIELLNDGKPLAVSAGAIDERTYLAFAEITEDDIEPGERIRGAEGEGERIERLFVSVDDLEGYVCEDLRVFALIQFFLRRS